MSKRIDITGKIFGDIYVVEFLGCKKTHAVYKCICMPCNRVRKVTYSNLKSGNTHACISCCKEKINYKGKWEVCHLLKEGLAQEKIAERYGVARAAIAKVKREFCENTT